MNPKPKKLPKTIDEALKQLQLITDLLESGKLSLEDSLPQSRRGLDIAKFLHKKLGAIENEIKEISQEFQNLNDNSNND